MYLTDDKAVDQTDDESIDVYMSFVYQTDDKLPTCTRVLFITLMKHLKPTPSVSELVW